MKKYLIYLMMAAAIVTFGACSPEDENEPQTPDIENPEKPDDGGEDVPDDPNNPENPDDPDQPGDNPDTPDSDSKILVAYFSWGGTTQRMAQEIVRQTGADLFRIEPVVPYPTEYTPCTEVALEEKNNDARPAIAATVENWEDYDTVFIGCPVWWWTTPMIIVLLRKVMISRERPLFRSVPTHQPTVTKRWHVSWNSRPMPHI